MAIRDLLSVFTTSATDAAFPSKVATVTKPTVGTGIKEIKNEDSTLAVMPYGTGADDSTITGMRVIGWRKVDTLWVPTVICEVACVLSTAVGVVNVVPSNSDRFADSITATYGNPVLTTVPANTAAMFLVLIEGYSLYEITVDLGTATAANALVAAY